MIEDVDPGVPVTEYVERIIGRLHEGSEVTLTGRGKNAPRAIVILERCKREVPRLASALQILKEGTESVLQVNCRLEPQPN